MVKKQDQQPDAGQHEAGAHDGPIRGDSVEEVELSEQAAEVVRQLQQERDEAVDARLRSLADFRNYQRRASENEQRALASGASRIVRAILPALDHFDLALGQNQQQMTLEHLLGAVGIVRDEFAKALASQGVQRIEPAPGEPFDPTQHEAVMTQAAEGVGPNCVTATLQTGYRMGDMVLRPAKVAVSAPADQL